MSSSNSARSDPVNPFLYVTSVGTSTLSYLFFILCLALASNSSKLSSRELLAGSLFLLSDGLTVVLVIKTEESSNKLLLFFFLIFDIIIPWSESSSESDGKTTLSAMASKSLSSSSRRIPIGRPTLDLVVIFTLGVSISVEVLINEVGRAGLVESDLPNNANRSSSSSSSLKVRILLLLGDELKRSSL
ncbi:hypothetical protein WICPIJ_006508 [Wickerhamomyces pijperi]|uniref:Uncharacterized protein n=1 Tax=Wickerhamomyces pijperi TaxID=599730 RepID=A0A9P8Q1K9_WICPI|nr:hypothetical protein WICPIJ_006508 [Wickerhamomyces pijperi]